MCGTQFGTRLRLLAHLSDVRRPKCRDRLQDGSFPALSTSRIAELDALDRIARRDAKRSGHTTPIAVGTALTADGKRIGHVQR